MRFDNAWLVKNLRNLPRYRSEVTQLETKIARLNRNLDKRRDKVRALEEVDEIYFGVALKVFKRLRAGLDLPVYDIRRADDPAGRRAHVYPFVPTQGRSYGVSLSNQLHDDRGRQSSIGLGDLFMDTPHDEALKIAKDWVIA